jgi:hypothetical protein
MARQAPTDGQWGRPVRKTSGGGFGPQFIRSARPFRVFIKVEMNW